MIAWYKKHRAAIQTGAMLCAVLFIAACLGISGPHPLEGKPAPAFSAPTLDGDTVELASYRGNKVVVLDFWASWCPPCREGLPAIAQLAEDFAGQDVAVYAVNQGEPKELVQDFLESQDLDLPVLLDEDQTIGAAYGVHSIPQTLVIDKAGQVVAGYQGYFSGLEAAVKEDVQTALAGPPADETTQAE